MTRFLLALLASLACLPLSAVDPATPGPARVIETGYDFGPTAWSDAVSRERCGFSARVYHPGDLGAGPYPLVLILHGRHQSTYDPATDNSSNAWPPPPGHLPIPNKDGYAWIAEPLASHGCIVVSISANAVTSFDSFYGDFGDGIRLRLLRAHLQLWQQLAVEAVAPFGERFVGAVDLDRVGLIGHSRGGEVVSRLAHELIAEGSPQLAAVGLIAPTNAARVELGAVPLGVILGQLDGDVTDCAGAHYFDDGRWRATADRYLAVLDGANHNFFNRYWDPDEFSAAARDDNVFADDAPELRLTGDEQRAAAASWLSAFFRQHLLGDERWHDLLIGEQALPGGAPCRRLWQPAAGARLAVNSGRSPTHTTMNDLGGAVSTDGALELSSIGGGFPLPDHILTDHHSRREIHWSGDGTFFPQPPGLRQHQLSWSTSNGVWRNELPAAAADVSGYASLHLRVGVNFENAANTAEQDQDLTLRLIDGSGAEADLRLGDHSSAGMWPLGTDLDGVHPFRFHMPRLILFQARLALADFSGIDLSDVRAVELRTDRRGSGAISVADLAFAGATDRPPIADPIALDDASPTLGSAITASISASDPDGDPITIAWNWGDGTSASGTSAEHTYAAPGRYVITATLSAGGRQIRRQRAIEVIPAGGNQTPTCSSLDDISIAFGATAGPLSFTVGDPDGPLSRLRVWATSNNQQLVATPGLLIGGSGSARTLSIQPHPSRSGSARITVHVSDGLATRTRTFKLTVAAGTLPPEMSWNLHHFPNPDDVFNSDPIANERWLARGSEHLLTARIFDRDTDAAAISTDLATSNASVLPLSAVTVASKPSSPTTYEVTIDLTAAAIGSAELTLTARDDTGNQNAIRVLVHIVEPGNAAPVITAVGAITDPVIMGERIDLSVDASDPDDGPAPLHVQWLISTPFPPGFNFEVLSWSLLPSGTDATRASFTTGNQQNLVDGDYQFRVVVHDGIDLVEDSFAVTVDNQSDHLLAWWPLDETGGTRRDRWQHRLHLQPQGSVARRTGQIGMASGFTGDSALVADDRLNSGLAVGDAMTIALWCRPDAVDGLVALIGKHRADQPGWALRLDAGTPQLLIHDEAGAAQTLTASSALPTGTWSHLAAVYDGDAGRWSLWVDGKRVANDNGGAPARMHPATAALMLGAAASDSGLTAAYTGALDQVLLFDAALSSDRIAAMAAAGSGNQAPLVRWIAPDERQTFASGSDVPLEISAVDPEGDPLTVQFLELTHPGQLTVRSRLLATVTSPPYRTTWSAPTDGTHAVVALVDDGERHALSAWRFVHIGTPLQLLPLPFFRRIIITHPQPQWLWDLDSGTTRAWPRDDASDFPDLDPEAAHRFVPVPSGRE